MLDIKFVRENPEAVKENIRKKFQNAKLPLVDEAIALDAERRQAIADGEALKAERNKLSKANGPLFGRLTNGHARALLPLSPALQETTAATILKNDLSVRQTEQLVKKLTAGKKEKPSPAGLIVDYAQEAARDLGNTLGRGCRIVSGKKKGRIELEYYGVDDLNELLEALHTIKKP